MKMTGKVVGKDYRMDVEINISVKSKDRQLCRDETRQVVIQLENKIHEAIRSEGLYAREIRVVVPRLKGF